MVKTISNTDPNHWYHRFTRLRAELERLGYYKESDRIRDAIRHIPGDEGVNQLLSLWERRLTKAREVAGENPHSGFSRRFPHEASIVT